MPIPVTQYNPNAFYQGADFVRQNRMQDTQLQRLYAQDQQAAADRTATQERNKVIQGRQDQQYEDEMTDREREFLAKVHAPMAQAALKSGNPRQFYAQQLSNPQTAALIQQDGIFEPADLDDPEFDQHVQAIAAWSPQAEEKPQEYTLSPGQKRFVNGKEVASVAPNAGADEGGFTLSPGQTRYGPNGKPLASSAPKPEGGPTMRDVANLRKEFEGTPEVKNYRSVLPLYDRAKKAPNTRAGDLSIIYALGKMFDPTSVVREGELILAQNTAPWLQKLASTANSQLTGKGAMSPGTRADIIAALDGQVDAFRQPYEQQRERFGSYASDYGIDAFKITGEDAKDAFAQPAAVPRGTQQGPVRVRTPAEAMALPPGTQFVTPDGRVKVRP